MKVPFLALAGCLISMGFALADPAANLRSEAILQTPLISAQDLPQIGFVASFDQTYPTPIKVELQNPFRDKSLRGIVVRVQTKAADGKAQTLDIFGDVQCGPLQTADF